MSKSYNLCQLAKGLTFQHHKVSQYARGKHRGLLNNVLDRLKHHWTFKVSQSTRDRIQQDAAKYIRCYNVYRLHSNNSNLSPVRYE